MESPVKKLNFNASDKENQPLDESAIAALADSMDTKQKPVDVTNKEEKAVVTSTIKPEEIDEPLLQENPQRFVLFPIKYHEVCDASVTCKVAPPQWTSLLTAI